MKLLRACRIQCLLVETPPVALPQHDLDLDLLVALDLAMTRAHGVLVGHDHLHAVELDLAVAVAAEIADVTEVVAIHAHLVEHQVHREVLK